MPLKLNTLIGFGAGVAPVIIPPLAPVPVNFSLLTKNPPWTREKPTMWAAGAHAITAGADRQLNGIPSPLFTLPLWEGSGSAKSMCQSYNLPLGGSANWIDTDWGLGVAFDGTGDSLIVDNSGSATHPLKPGFPMTIECVVICNDPGSNELTIWSNDVATDRYSGITLSSLTASNNFQILIGEGAGNGSGSRRNWNFGSWTAGEPNHIICIIDSLTVFRSFFNGINQNSGAPGGSGSGLGYTTANVGFGLAGRAFQFDFNGKILFFEHYDFAYTNEYAEYRSHDIWDRLRMPK